MTDELEFVEFDNKINTVEETSTPKEEINSAPMEQNSVPPVNFHLKKQ